MFYNDLCQLVDFPTHTAGYVRSCHAVYVPPVIILLMTFVLSLPFFCLQVTFLFLSSFPFLSKICSWRIRLGFTILKRLIFYALNSFCWTLILVLFFSQNNDVDYICLFIMGTILTFVSLFSLLLKFYFIYFYYYFTFILFISTLFVGTLSTLSILCHHAPADLPESCSIDFGIHNTIGGETGGA